MFKTSGYPEGYNTRKVDLKVDLTPQVWFKSNVLD